ncbi:hypothetical protein PPRY_a0524 [Pseudoalteromonas prydzensis ACAM 620]|nr:hypothetical protein [Pseudoalteromonas prydzensis ACAM 620]
MLCLGLKNENSVWHRLVDYGFRLARPWWLYARQSMAGTATNRAGLASGTDNSRSAG